MTIMHIDGATPGSIRGHNRGLVMKRVFDAGRISRTQIATDTGLTAAAISRITRELLNLNLIEEGSFVLEQSRPGRRSVELSVSSKGAYVIGIGAGAFEQWVRLANLRGEVVFRCPLRLVGLGPEQAATAIVETLRGVLKKDALRSCKLIGCGVAIAGVVDPATGQVISSPNFGWEQFPLGPILERELGTGVTIESLHHALNLAEASLGQTVGMSNILLVNAALGIGASVLADGRIVRGQGTAAGQIGHIPVDGVDEPCTCGRRGCLDTVASGHAVLTRLGQLPPRDQPKKHEAGDAILLEFAMARAAAGDHEAIEAFRIAGQKLGKTLAAIRMVTDPECIVLAGPLAQVPSYVEGTREMLQVARMANEPVPQFMVSDQQVDSAGAWLALQRFVFSEQLDPASFRLL